MYTKHVFSYTFSLVCILLLGGGGGGGNVPAYRHELMEGVLHPYIFKGRCSHSERCACGDMEDDDRHMPQRYTRVQWSVQSPWKTKPSTL